MSPVKLIHVLKRLQILDRDIKELHNMEQALNTNRSYSDAMKISVERQINNLLNERVKLMEVRIENPPEQLIPNDIELEDPSVKLLENRSKFKLEDMEQDYLNQVMSRKNGNSSFSESMSQEDIDSYIDENQNTNSAY